MEDALEIKLKQAEGMLDVFEANHNLAEPKIANEIDHIMNLNYQQLEKLQAIQCAEYSYMLSQYAFYVQRIHNRESSTLKWIQDQVNNYVAQKWNNYDSFTRFEIRPRLIAQDNEVMARLLQRASFYEQKIERLNFIANSINKMSDKLENLQKAKNYQSKADYGRQY